MANTTNLVSGNPSTPAPVQSLSGNPGLGATVQNNQHPIIGALSGLWNGFMGGVQNLANNVSGNTMASNTPSTSQSYTNSQGQSVPNLSANGTVYSPASQGGLPLNATGGSANSMTFPLGAGMGSSQSTNSGTTPPQYSGFNSLNGQPISATNPQATAAQLQANLAAGQGYGSTPPVTQPTPTSGVGTSIFPGLATTLSQTQPNSNTNAAVGNLQQTASGTAGGTNQQNIYGGAQTSANIAQNQTPAVNAAYQNLQQFNKNSPLIEQGFLNNPNLTAGVAAGRGQIVGNQLTAQGQALGNQYSAALQGEQNQLTGAQQQATAGVQGQQNQNTAANNAGNLANTAQSNQIGAQTSALQAVQPNLGAYGQTYYQPTQAGTNQGGINGLTGPAAAGAAQGQAQAGQTYTQNQALIGKAVAQFPGLQNEITQSNFNANPVTYVNALTNWAKNGTSDPSIPEVTNALNDIAGSLGGVLGVPSSAGSDLRTTLAQGLVSSLQQGSSITDALQFALDQATAGNAGYLQGATGQGNANTTTGVYSNI